MSMKIPLTPSGIEPETFRFVAHTLTTVPPRSPPPYFIQFNNQMQNDVKDKM